MSLFHTVINNKTEIYSDWLQENILSLCDKTFKIPNDYNFEILEVSERYIARPDLLSLDIYGDTIYTDLLCKLNGISNPFELNKGMLMVIPSPDNIMDFMHTPSGNDLDQNMNNVNTKPVAKTKNEKRKANEALIGDARFKINKKSGIVIY